MESRWKCGKTMGRYKVLIGPWPRALGLAAQQTEAAIGVAVLNQRLAFGRPDVRTPSVAWAPSHGRSGRRSPSPECAPMPDLRASGRFRERSNLKC